MSSYRWLLMDADNTLFDFNAAEEYAITRTLVHYGLSPAAGVKACYKGANAAVWAAFEKGLISQEALRVKRFELFLEAQKIEGDPKAWNNFYMDAMASCSTLLPGAESLCRNLSRRYILCLTTNGSTLSQRRRLEASPLARFFEDRVFISEEMGSHKPERAYFDKVLSALEVNPRQRTQALVIGDSLSSDILGAFNARLDSVWLRWPSSKPGPIKATYEVENLAQLSQLLNADRLVPIRP